MVKRPIVKWGERSEIMEFTLYTASKCCITSLLSNAIAISRDDLPVLFCLSGSAPASNNT